MSLWSFKTGLIWSFHNNTLYTARMFQGMQHQSLHVKHNLPVQGAAFDAVQRGRALFTPTFKAIEVVSTGRYEHITNACYDAIVKHFDLDPKTAEVQLLEPGWDSDPMLAAG